MVLFNPELLDSNIGLENDDLGISRVVEVDVRGPVTWNLTTRTMNIQYCGLVVRKK